MLLAMPDGIKHHSANAPVNRVASGRVAAAAAAKPKLVVTELIDSTGREAAAAAVGVAVAVAVAVVLMRCHAMRCITQLERSKQGVHTSTTICRTGE